MSSPSGSNAVPYELAGSRMELNESQMRRLSLMLPVLLRASPELEAVRHHRGRVRIIILDRSAGAMMVIEGTGDVESVLEGLPGKPGVLPASEQSIEGMPTVSVSKEEGEGGDCSICLEGYEEVGGEAREMPCKHTFHSHCIQKWLRIHGSCPVCRFVMPPAEETTTVTLSEGAPERRDGRRGTVSVSVWLRAMDNDDHDDDDDADDPMDEDMDVEESDEHGSAADGDSAEDDESWMILQEPEDMEF